MNTGVDQRALASLRAFVACSSHGAKREALVSASEACNAMPDLAEAHYAYGQAWLTLNEPGRAEQAFATAVRLRPDWPDAWINYGLARYRRGAVSDAIVAMLRALAAMPGHPAATANLCALLRIDGGAEAAEMLLRETLARDPDNVGARLNLAADLLQEERSAEVLGLLDEAAPPMADLRALRHWRLQRSLALLQLRRPAEARAELDAFAALGPVPPDLAPLWRWRLTLLATEEGDLARARAEAEAMEEALVDMGPDAVLEHQIMAHYDLARFWSAQRARARAFAQWTAGHAILKRIQPFSRADHKAFVDANIETFSAARFASGPRAANRHPAPVFIVGMPRTGTTLCEQILAAHGDVHGAGERAALAETFQALGGGEGAEAVRRLAGLDAAQLDAAAASYLSALQALASDKSRIVDKMPGNFLYLGLVGLMLPGAKIIHCIRDPRDAGLSIFTYRFYGHHGYAHDLADLGWYIGEHDRLTEHWKAASPIPILTVRLSDCVEDFDATLARVLAHVDLPFDPNCARFHEGERRVRTVSRAQVREPVNARGLGRWLPYARELGPLIAELDRAGSLAGWRSAPVELSG